MPTPPSLTPEARQAALDKAGHARRVRAELKVRLQTGALSFVDLLVEAQSDQIVASTKVLTILESLPGVGKVTARRTMAAVGIAANRRVRGLGNKQKEQLVEAFG